MEFRLLGTVEAYDDDRRPVELGRRRERCLLGLLLLHPHQVIPAERLVELLWDEAEEPPKDPMAALRTYVSRLRARLPAGPGWPRPRLVTVHGGYRVDLDPATVDAHRFRALVDRARAEPDPARRAALAAEALALWRGPLLADVATEALRQRIGAELAELRLAATELRIDAELALGHGHELIGRLRGLVAEHPTQEPLVERLMLALHRAGRHTEAIEAFQQLRARLAETLGTDPGQQLQRRFQAVLRHDPALDGDHEPKTAGPVPRQLPAGVTGFVGRDDVLKDLDAMLDHRPGEVVVIAAISGTAGIGKTAVAVHWAHRVAGRFPDGQLHANLRGYDPGEPLEPAVALDGFLRALGVEPARIPSDLDGLSALFRSTLADRRVLVLLDNARSVGQVRPLLPGTPGCLALVTSRDDLAGLVARDGAHRVVLDRLPEPDACDLLARVLGAERVQAEPEATAELVRRCDRLPLALRVAAERAARRPTASLAALAAELADRSGRLDALDTRDPGSALREVISWSYRAVSPPAQRLFRLLGQSPGPDTAVPAVAALAGADAPTTTRLLAELTGAHLLDEAAGHRYQLHDLLRAYAAEQARTDQADATAALARMLAWYLHTADAADRAIDPYRRHVLGDEPPGRDPVLAFASRDQGLAWCAAEHATLVAAVQAAFESAQYAIAWQLPVALWSYFYAHSRWQDWLVTHRIGVAAAQRLGDTFAEAWVLNSLGVAHRDLREYDQAIECFQRSSSLRRAHGDLLGESSALDNLGTAYLRVGRFDEAIECRLRAIDLLRRIGDRSAEAGALTNLGSTYRELGQHGRAREYHEQALRIQYQVDDRYGISVSLHNLGKLHLAMGQPDQALDVLRRGLALRRELADARGAALLLTDLGDALHALGEPAGDSWREALAILEEVHAPEAGELRERLARWSGGGGADQGTDLAEHHG